MLVLRWLWERVNLYAEILSIAVSLVAAPILLVTVDAEWLRLAVMAGVSTAAVLLAAFAMPETDAESRVRFFRIVQPLGWWRATARAAAADAAAPLVAFWRALALLAACALSVYCWLIGFGTLLLHGDEQLTGIVLLMVGSGAAVAWIAALRRRAV